MYEIKQMREDELYHFGVPGMKWGKRKTAASQSFRTDLKKKGNTKAERKAIKNEYRNYKNSRNYSYNVANTANNNEKAYTKKVDKYSKKVDKLQNSNNSKKLNKYISKRDMANYEKQANEQLRKYLTKKVNQMDSLSIKSGKDYAYSIARVRNVAFEDMYFKDDNYHHRTTTIENYY